MADCEQPPQETICPDHPDKAIELWCKTCEELACAKCWPLKHNGSHHVLIDVKEAANNLSTAVNTHLDVCSSDQFLSFFLAVVFE